MLKKFIRYAHFLKNLLKNVIYQNKNDSKTTQKIGETITSTQVGEWNTEDDDDKGYDLNSCELGIEGNDTEGSSEYSKRLIGR